MGERKIVSGFIGAALILVLPATWAASGQAADAWITHPDAQANQPRHEAPRSWRVKVTADARFTLYVNGARLAAAP